MPQFGGPVCRLSNQTKLCVYCALQTVLSSQNRSTLVSAVTGGGSVDDVHAMSSLDLSDVMHDFSQINVASVVVACLIMVYRPQRQVLLIYFTHCFAISLQFLADRIYQPCLLSV